MITALSLLFEHSYHNNEKVYQEVKLKGLKNDHSIVSYTMLAREISKREDASFI